MVLTSPIRIRVIPQRKMRIRIPQRKMRIRVVPRLIPTDGKDGPPNVLAMGTVQGGDTAAASITGSSPSQVLNLVLPKGDKGDVGPKGDKGDKGDKGGKGDQGDVGPAGTITGATATGLAAGAAPTVTLGGTPQARTFAFGIPKGDKGDQGGIGDAGPKGDKGDKGDQGDVGPKGDKGDTGDDGWTPVFAVVADGDRYVQQVTDWTGGTGTKPAVGQYVGPSGFVSTIGDAVNIRGASGSGTGDVVGPSSAADGEMALFDGTTGKLVKGGGAPFSGSYNDLSNKPDLSGFATTAQLTAGLSGKFDNPTGTTSQYIRGDGSLATFPAIPAGTVTSVGLSAPTGFTVSGSPVSSSGTLTFAYASGYTGFTTTLQSKLDGIEAGAQVNTVTSVAGKTGAVTLVAADVSGLGGAATLNVGTGSGTVAAGDDSRITGAVQTSRSIATQHSLQGGGNLSGNRTLSLVGDTASPGSNKVYGTDGSGARGWKDDPAGGGIGVGQTWQDVTASRSQATTYHNTTGKPIMIAIQSLGSGVSHHQVSPNGSNWLDIGYGHVANAYHSSYYIVPDNWRYRMGPTPAGSIRKWMELR